MKRVVVVGAGATLAEALPSNPKRGMTPPLDASFFDLCNAARFPGTKPIASYMVQRFGIDPFGGGYGMEEIFNMIYSDSTAPTPPAGCLEAYWSLLRLYACAIGSTTNEMSGTSQSGVGAILRASYRQAPTSDLVFVTFNQDLVIEKAIEAAASTAKYSTIPWSLESSYRVPFVDCSAIRGKSVFRTGAMSEPSIPILKLHGSLNWLYNVRSRTDPKNAIRSNSPDLHCLNSREVLQDLRYKSQGRYVHVTPLIVPPIFEKAARYGGSLAQIWADAGKEIASCDSLIFFGYSLPPADAWARTMLRASLNANTKLAGISVVDPSAASAMRLRDVAGTRALHHHVDVRSLLKGGLGWT